MSVILNNFATEYQVYEVWNCFDSLVISFKYLVRFNFEECKKISRFSCEQKWKKAAKKVFFFPSSPK